MAVLPTERPVLIGLISDTHGLLRQGVAPTFAGVELIVHAGDVGGKEILDGLRDIAPVRVVRGNTDPRSSGWPQTEVVPLGPSSVLYVLHDLAELDLDPPTAGVRVVVSGHTHLPLIQERGGVLFVNPGSAGPRRFDYPISVGLLKLGPGGPTASIVEID